MNLFVNPGLKNKTIYITSDIFDYARESFGRKHELKAWAEFIGMDPDDYEEGKLYMEIFVPWYLYSWQSEISESVAEYYVQDKMFSLTEHQKEFIQSCIDNIYSFYQIEESAPGHYIKMKDLISRRSFIVFEQKASQGLHEGDIIFTKMASIGELNFLVGSGSVIIPSSNAKMIYDFGRKRSLKNDEFSRMILYYTIIAKTLECCDCNHAVKTE